MNITTARLSTKVKQCLALVGGATQRQVVYTCVALLSAVALTACTSTTEQERNLSAVVSHYSDQKYPAFKHTFVNLNNDGVDDAIVFLQGTSWCVTEGCVMLVLRGVGTGFRVISKSIATMEEIRVAASHNNGWLDIIVHSDGAERLLEFDGVAYPPNASTLPAATQEQIDSATIVLPRS